MSLDGCILYKQRKNLLDVYQVGANRVGIFRESFERVMELDGFELTPSGEVHEIWDFTNSISGLRGRLINVEGYLGDSTLTLTTQGRAYLVTRQEFTLGLLFPSAPRRLKLSEIRYRVLPDKEQRAALPLLWPVGAVDRVIRHRFRNIIILEDGFFLEQIGLRGKVESAGI